jgi:hypothetical protein
MIEPTPGRVVWYRPAGSHPSAQPHAALVAFVHDERLVNLMIVGHDGISYPGTEIPLLQDGDPRPSPEQAPRGHAEWMPYQKGQAAKAEALQAQAPTVAPIAPPPPAATPAPPIAPVAPAPVVEAAPAPQTPAADPAAAAPQ